MKKIALVRSPASFLTVIVVGLVQALAAAGRLRFAYPFRDLFEPTCMYLPDDEVIPSIAVLLFGLTAVVVSSVLLLRRSALARRLVLGVVVSALAFGVGVYCTDLR